MGAERGRIPAATGRVAHPPGADAAGDGPAAERRYRGGRHQRRQARGRLSLSCPYALPWTAEVCYRPPTTRSPKISCPPAATPAQLPPGAVLVAGSGQSGLQIAADLIRAGRRVFLATGRCGWVPQSYRGRDIACWLVEMGLLERTGDSLPSRRHGWPAFPQVSDALGRCNLNLHARRSRSSVPWPGDRPEGKDACLSPTTCPPASPHRTPSPPESGAPSTATPMRTASGGRGTDRWRRPRLPPGPPGGALDLRRPQSPA